MPLILQRHMSLLWGWWRQYMWTWWSPFRTGRSTSMQFTYLQCEFALLSEKSGSYLYFVLCIYTYKLKNMLVRNENKNIKWQGRSCHVHRDCHRYHTSPWTNHHSCEGGSYKHSKAWNDFWNNLFSQLMSQRGNDNDWKQRFGHNLVMVFAYPIALLYM